jgi:hypothetical protein
MHKLITRLIIGVLVLSMVVVGTSLADPGIPALFETQGVRSSLTISSFGSFSESKVMSLQISTGPLDSTLEDLGAMDYLGDGQYIVFMDVPVINDVFGSQGEVQYTTSYSESTSATGGFTEYSGQLTVDTANKVLGTSNVQAHRSIQYSTYDGNNQLSSSEKLTLDGAGKMNFAEDALLCPFGPAQSDFIPEFCNIVQSGSDFLITGGSVVTDANERFIGATSDFPVEENYGINMIGLDGLPAAGSVSAFMKMHAQEGGVDTLYEVPLGINNEKALVIQKSQAADVTYQENLAASGLINQFKADMQYQSGAIRI